MGIYTKIHGISHNQDVLKTLKVKDKLKLVREPNNQFDKNAIAVYTMNDNILGYINKYQNFGIAQDMDRKRQFEVEIESITGQNKDFLGCNIHIYEKEVKQSNDLFVGDGFIRFSILNRFINLSSKNSSISITKEDFEKCYKHYLETKK